MYHVNIIKKKAEMAILVIRKIRLISKNIWA